MKDIFNVICEARIREAIQRGDLENLPDAGKPLQIRDLSFLPPEMRAGFLILLNSGYLDENRPTDLVKLPEAQEEFSLSKGIDYNSKGEQREDIKKEKLLDKAFRFNVMIDSRRRF